MSKHTPGPWSLDTENVGDYLRGHVSVDAPDHGALALVVWKMEDDDQSPVCEANARLIAAAPDLLEALRFIEANTVEGGAFNKVARAAIAKATGGDHG